MAEITYLEGIRQAMFEEMRRDESVVVLGEDVAEYGGAFKVTKGLHEEFGGERVINTPIAESGIVGAAIGMSMMGMKPIAEMQFIDFITCAFDQITTYAAKSRYRWGVGIRMERRLTKHIRASLRYRYNQQSSGFRTVGRSSDFANNLVTLGVHYDFDRWHLW